MKPALSKAESIANWASATDLIDGVVFAPPESAEAPVCAVALARGVPGYGKGHTQSEALVSAVGEAVERWAAAQVDRSKLIRAAFCELRDAFDPRWLCLYSEAQYTLPGFPYQAFDPARPMHWIAGKWLDTGEPVFLPAFAVHLARELGMEALCQVSSNGLAAGSDVADAAERAVSELYERDAFLCSWISLSGTELVEKAGKREIFRIASAGSVSVAACVECDAGITLGLGAAESLASAIDKAILEQEQTGPYLKRKWNGRTICQVQTLEDAGLYYCDPANRGEFDRWRIGALDRVQAVGSDDIRIAVVDLTPDELQESPFRVVRALGRGLQPVECGAAFQRLPVARLAALLDGGTPNSAPPPIC